MKPSLSFLLSTACGFLIFALVIALVGPARILLSLQKMHLRIFLAMLAFSLLGRFLLAYRWKIILEAMDYTVGIGHLMWYHCTSFTFGYLLPSAQFGGEPIRAILLKRHDVPLPKGLSSVVVDASVGFTTSVLVGGIGIILLTVLFAISPYLRIALLAALAAISGGLVVYYSRILSGKPVFSIVMRFLRLDRGRYVGRIYQQVEQMEGHVFRFFRDQRRILLKVVLLSVVGLVLLLIEMRIALMVVGQEGTLLQVLVVDGMLALSSLLPVPGAMGVQEAGQATVGSILPFTSPMGVAVSLVIRARDSIWVLVGCSFLAIHGPKTARSLMDEWKREGSIVRPDEAHDIPEAAEKTQATKQSRI